MRYEAITNVLSMSTAAIAVVPVAAPAATVKLTGWTENSAFLASNTK